MIKIKKVLLEQLNIKIQQPKLVSMCGYKLATTGKITRKYTQPKKKYFF